MTQPSIICNFSVTTDELGQRLFYQADRQWPPPAGHVTLPDSAAVLTYDERGRPSDVKHQLTAVARQKIRSRRTTPKGMALPEDV